MGTYVDENDVNINSESEVRKLQALVKRLEQQNQVLRSKQNDVEEEKPNDMLIKSNTRPQENTPLHTSSNKNKGIRQSVEKTNETKSFAGEVLDLNDQDEDEDSWLYASPKKTSPTTEKSDSPHDWMRQDLEDPSPEIASSRRSLVFKLNDAARMVRSPSSGGLSSSLLTPSPASSPVSQTYRPPQTSSSASSPLSQTYKSVSESSGSHISPHTLNYIQSRKQRLQNQETPAEVVQIDDNTRPTIKKPLRGLGSRVNTNTFRKKKNPLLNHTVVIGGGEEDNEDQTSQELARNSPYEGGASGKSEADGVVSARTLSRNSSAENPTPESPRGSDYKLTDVVDVQVLARMQEESLRQSMNSPKLTKKTMTRPRPVNDSNGYGSTRSSPGRYLDNDGYRSMHRSNQSLGSLSSNSDSPANSPYSSQYLDSVQQDGHRRSLPNLAKSMPMSLPSHPSDPQLSDNTSGQPPKRTSASSVQQPQRRGSPSPRLSGAGGRYQMKPSGSTTPRMGGGAGRSLGYTSKSPASASRLQQQGQTMTRTVSPKRAINVPDTSYTTSRPSTANSNILQSPERSYSPQRTLSPQRGLPATSTNRNASPLRSSLPTPTRSSMSGIPRPGSASKLPGPKKSAIPASRRAALFNKTDESWKDGCY